jgi:prepilin-type N-terminal cleavage/methylation domain-containing protein
MKKFINNQHGFTLVELMIVIVIVGILAAVAIPIYQGNIKKAKMSECDAALGTIRTALRVFYAENQQYPDTEGASVDTTFFKQYLNISHPDLDGRYFSAGNYKLTSTPTTYVITCDNDDIFPDSARVLDQGGIFSGGL